MGNEFFNNHPMLGSVFDFNRDGSLNLGEAGVMAAVGSMVATEFMRAADESESGADYDTPVGQRKEKRRDSRDLEFGDDYVVYDEDRVYDIDTSDTDEVMEAVTSGEFGEADIEYLVHEALCNGVEFDNDEAEGILDNIQERDLREWVEAFLD